VLPTPGPVPPSVSILGVPVDDVDMDEAVDRIVALVHDGRRTGRCHQVATVNVDFVVNALDDRELTTIMQSTALSIPDGMAIVWAARMLGEPLRTRVAGADLVPALAERAAGEHLRLALYGAAPGVADRAARVLTERTPGAEVWADPGPVFGDVAELTDRDVEALAGARPDIACIAFGNPKQERFIARFGPELGIPVMIGVGGSLDFLVGAQRRAPRWMQRSGLEWFHRAASDPQRLAGRYARDARAFFPRLGRELAEVHVAGRVSHGSETAGASA
jgi:N-acetylglucosaminyldiphosphoundecaprenol N-acetyl-beta-D-mannosaminyltransferase